MKRRVDFDVILQFAYAVQPPAEILDESLNLPGLGFGHNAWAK